MGDKQQSPRSDGEIVPASFYRLPSNESDPFAQPVAVRSALVAAHSGTQKSSSPHCTPISPGNAPSDGKIRAGVAVKEGRKMQVVRQRCSDIQYHLATPSLLSFFHFKLMQRNRLDICTLLMSSLINLLAKQNGFQRESFFIRADLHACRK